MFKKDVVIYYSFFCKHCQRSINIREGEEINNICPSCGRKMEGGEAIETHPKYAARNLKRPEKHTSAPVQQPTRLVPKCPYCQSTNIKEIGTLSRLVSVGLFGLASKKIGKTHECNDCGSTW